MPHRGTRLSLGARVYIAVIVVTGTLSVGASVYDLKVAPPSPQWLVLAGLAFLTGSFSIKLPSINARISVSEAFVFAAVLLFGPSAATIIVTLDAIILSSWASRRRHSKVRAAFNICAAATAIWVAAHLFRLLLPQTPSSPTLDEILVPVVVLAASYFGINSFFIAIAVSYEKSTSPIEIWKQNFAWVGLNYVGGASVAMLLVTYRQSIDFMALSVILPILAITYLTFRTSLGRLADATRHVTQVNDLYLSTIETLAMAVDAKDQITHGHIRRVQVYAVELAKRLGVSEASQLKAIEAAALLHDMGKLAIPEHILNKPGKLTPAEFETMKRHADIGADLLSSIRFPYPVVPIVRHHHEQWNGHGYPSGISGTDIPLGARILAVVDCFDALNSDRPYRPRLSVPEAFAILRERRATMYDPLVVDQFLAGYQQMVAAANEAGEQARSLLVAHAAVDSGSNALEEIRAVAADGAVLAATRQNILDARALAEVMNCLGQAVRQLTPSSACAYFRYSSDTDDLLCEYVSSEKFSALVGLRIRPGERVTGWVAANRQTISNSDATLDLGQASLVLDPRPRSAVSTPVAGPQGDFHGVLTAYSPVVDVFTHRHVYAFEQLANSFGEHLSKIRPKSSKLVSFQQRHGSGNTPF
jgi:putative nucleotidyltransferase with HDIG domain